MKNLLKGIVVLTAVFLLAYCNRGSGNTGFTSFFGGAGGGAAGGAASLPVVAEDVRRETISAYIITTATLDADSQIDVLAQISGKVVRVFAEEGDLVEAGSLLARLDQSAAELDLSEVQAHYDNARRIFERTEKLVKTNDVSSEEFANQKYQNALWKSRNRANR